jgi:hypothetical protein
MQMFLRLLLVLLTLIGLAGKGISGTWTANNFLYKPATGARGEAQKNLFDSGLDRIDARLGKEVWVRDPNYGQSLQSAIAAIGYAQRILRVPSGTYNITSDLTVPANITLKPERGTLFLVATGKTLTINGPFQAGPYQVFSCTGTGKVVFGAGAVKEVYPEWWGTHQDAVTAAGASITAIGGALRLSQPLTFTACATPYSNVTYEGRNGTSAVITCGGDFAAFKATATVSNVTFKGIKFVSSATTQPDIYFYNGSESSDHIRIEHCWFQGGYRGASFNAFDNLYFGYNKARNLTSAALYAGSAATVSANLTTEFNDLDTCDTSESTGGLTPVQVDGVRMIGDHIVDCGVSNHNGVNHGIYIRECINVAIISPYIKGQKGGNGIEVYANTDSGETAPYNIVIIDPTILETAGNYGINFCTGSDYELIGGIIQKSYNNGFYGNGISGLKILSTTFDQNNQQGSSGALAGAAIWLNACSHWEVINCTAKDDTATTYGQGQFIYLASYPSGSGTSTDGLLSGNEWSFAGSSGYGFCNLAATTTRLKVVNNAHLVNSYWFICGDGTAIEIMGNTCLSNYFVPDNYNQWHKWVIRNNAVNGSPYRKESDGVHVVQWDTAAPTSGTWVQGDKVWNTAPTAGGVPGWVCVTGGTPGTWKAMAPLAN